MTDTNPTVAQTVRAMNDFSDKTVLITGARGQLGRTFCRGFKEAGATVIGADTNTQPLDETIWDRFFQLNTSSETEIDETFARIADDFGQLDVLVNNAGISVFDPFDDRREEDLDHVFGVNIKGTFWCIRNFARIATDRGGQIVNIASHYGVVSCDPRIYIDLDRQSPEIYGATKAGVIQLTQYFAVHLAGQGIRVNAVSPGGVFNPDSPQGPGFLREYGNRCPMGRMANQEDIVGGVLFLASDAARYVNGHNLIIDGGFTVW